MQTAQAKAFKASFNLLDATYILTIAGVFILRVKRPAIPHPYKAFGYPVLPMLYILAAGTICISLLVYKPKFTFPGLGIVLLGIPIYYLFGKNKQVIEEAPVKEAVELTSE